MAAADPCALNIQPENNLQVVQLPAALQIPQMKQDAVLPFMKSLLNQTANTPEDAHQIQQIESAKFLIEQYYNEKIADMDPTDRRATKYELEALDDRIQSTLGLEVNKKRAIERAGDADLEFEAEVCNLTVDGKRAAATAITSLATEDFESATQWMLVSHHYDRIITSKAQQRQEQGFVPDIQRPSRSKRERFLSPRSKIRGQTQITDKNSQIYRITQRIINHNSQVYSVIQSSIQQVPTTTYAQQYQQPIIQILLSPQPYSYQCLILPSHQQPFNNSNNFHQQNRGRGGSFKRDQQGNITPYLNYFNSRLQQPSQFQNQQQNQFQSQLASLLPNQPTSSDASTALEAKHE